MNYYNQEIEEVLEKLKTSSDGLLEEEAFRRLQKYGKNELPKKKQDGLFKIFFRQLLDPIILILLVTIAFSFITHEYYDAIVVIFIVLIDLIMGTIQEYTAVKKALSLENIIKVNVKVLNIFKKIILWII